MFIVFIAERKHTEPPQLLKIETYQLASQTGVFKGRRVSFGGWTKYEHQKSQY